jgi:hypothetical protein
MRERWTFSIQLTLGDLGAVDLGDNRLAPTPRYDWIPQSANGTLMRITMAQATQP